MENNRELKITNIADIQALPMVWLWKDKIPKGSLTLFSGNPGVGKTLALLDIIARYSTGREWPDGAANEIEPGEVLLLNAEDDKARSVKPRLLAAGYAPGSVSIIDGTTILSEVKKKVRPLILLRDLDLLEARVEANGRIGLVVIDPVSNYLGDSDMNSAQDVREVLTPVREFAERTGVTVNCNSHFNKRGDVMTALQKVGGASALVEVPRAVWLFDRDKEDRALFHMIRGKVNDSKQRTGMKYRIGERTVVDGDVTLVEIPFVDWQGEEELNADEQLIMGGGGNVAEKAAQFLDDFLTEERPATILYAVAKSRGISRDALFDARKLRPYVKAEQRSGEWFWRVNPDLKRKLDTATTPDPEPLIWTPEPDEVEF